MHYIFTPGYSILLTSINQMCKKVKSSDIFNSREIPKISKWTEERGLPSDLTMGKAAGWVQLENVGT